MPEKKKILHLITGLEIGGTEMMLLRLLPKMQNDFDNRVCCIIGEGTIGKKLEAAGVPVYYLLLRSPLDFGCIFRFKKVILSVRPNILITYLIHADLFGRIFGRLFGVKKIICNERGALLQWEFLRFFDRFTSSLVDKYVVQTSVAKQELMKILRVSEDKFEIIPNAIDASEYDFKIDGKAKKRALGINQDNLNIVCVSNLRRGKGHEYLLEAFEDIYKKNKRMNLLIVGDGEKREILKKQISTYTSKNDVYFLGKRDDVKEILKISDIFVLPTLGEGMSNAIMEAMASKIPIITTDIPENKILLENPPAAIFVKPKNVQSIINAVLSIIENPSATETRVKNAESSLRQKYELQSVNKLWINILLTI